MKFYIRTAFIILITFSSIGIKVFAMSSSRYQISTDSVNFGGTDNGASAKYIVSDSFGEIGSGFSSSTRYSMSAGYRMLQESYISITSPNDVALPGMSGMISGQSTSSESWTVTTDNSAGYELLVKSLTSPALKSSGGAYFSDYQPSATGTPDYAFSVAPTYSVFAFSPEGVDVSQTYLDNGIGSQCGTGSTETQDRCWDGFSTTGKVVSHRSSSNQPSGTVTTVKYRTAIGSSKLQDSGSYTATIVATAVAL